MGRIRQMIKLMLDGQLVGALAQAASAKTILIEPGNYRGGLNQRNLQAKRQQPTQ